MKTQIRGVILFSISFLLLVGLTTGISEYSIKPYSHFSNPSELIEKAVPEATENCKRILLIFGADWCTWCNKLSKFIVENEHVSKLLDREYILIKVNIGKWDKNQDMVRKYNVERKAGIPSVVLLDEKGKFLLFEETGSLEAGKGYSEEKVLDFLNQNIARDKGSCK
jgi:thioredoxin-related protein